jgi:hypothetical protein
VVLSEALCAMKRVNQQRRAHPAVVVAHAITAGQWAKAHRLSESVYTYRRIERAKQAELDVLTARWAVGRILIIAAIAARQGGIEMPVVSVTKVEAKPEPCPTCGTQRGKPAHPAHAVCKGCVQAPQRVRERLEVAVAVALRDQHNAARAAQEARSALTEEERERYDAYMLLHSRSESGDTLTEKERRRLDATSAAYTNRADPRVSDALRTARHTDECLYWVNAALQAKCKTRDTLLATLALCLEDLGRKDDAEKLYR